MDELLALIGVLVAVVALAILVLLDMMHVGPVAQFVWARR